MFFRDRYYLFTIFSSMAFVFLLGFFKMNISYFWYFEKPLAFLNLVLIFPIVEEILFRGIILEQLEKRMKFKYANVLASVLFAIAHIFYHPFIWAISTFIPSLIFGEFKRRHKTLWSPICLHVLFNLFYFSVYEF